MALADRIAVIANGRFIQTATSEDIYLKPATLGVARLFGDPPINTADTKIEVTGKAVNVTLGGVKVPIDSAYKNDGKRDVTFGVRPEAVEISTPGDAGLMAKVMAVTPLNERTVLLLQSEGGWEFLASFPSSATNIPEPGAKVKATFTASGTHLFDKKTAERLHG
jgi:multiple sugar transport system ATP-binding protein